MSIPEHVKGFLGLFVYQDGGLLVRLTCNFPRFKRIPNFQLPWSRMALMTASIVSIVGSRVVFNRMRVAVLVRWSVGPLVGYTFAFSAFSGAIFALLSLPNSMQLLLLCIRPCFITVSKCKIPEPQNQPHCFPSKILHKF